MWDWPFVVDEKLIESKDWNDIIKIEPKKSTRQQAESKHHVAEARGVEWSTLGM
jgi:hypothetical protein